MNISVTWLFCSKRVTWLFRPKRVTWLFCPKRVTWLCEPRATCPYLDDLNHRDRVVDNRAFGAAQMRAELAEGRRSLDTFRADLDRLSAQLEEIKALPRTQYVSARPSTLV